jgi:catechol 2,3-dioxygenase-like lactoylglutathione lyase family enzyme
MKLDSMYPVLLTDDVAGCSAFFVEHMGFEERFKSDWYVSLVHGGNGADGRLVAQLRGSRRPERARPAHSRGVEILQPMQDLPAGQRHFICRAPGGVMVDVIEVVPPSGEYADNYVS